MYTTKHAYVDRNTLERKREKEHVAEKKRGEGDMEDVRRNLISSQRKRCGQRESGRIGMRDGENGENEEEDIIETPWQRSHKIAWIRPQNISTRRPVMGTVILNTKRECFRGRQGGKTETSER